MMVLALLGIFGVPGWLLYKGHGYRSMTPRGLRAYRGGVIGYGVALLIVATLLLLPPYLWPPSALWMKVLVSGGLLLGPVLGAGVGGLTARD